MYDSVHQMQPLLPADHHLDPLRERAADIMKQSAALCGRGHSSTLDALRELVRAMNSYYSNRIEGQGTHPVNIERALRSDFSDQPAVAHLQRIAVAHIYAERELEGLAQSAFPFSADFVQVAHAALYKRLLPDDRLTKDDRLVEPGRLRQTDVEVGRHVSPKWESIPRFLQAFASGYDVRRPGNTFFIVVACAHHRMTWIHPFLDGTGRAARLQTHAALMPVTQGLWSVNRGLARDADAYYGHLAAADAHRQGDLDGRGNLSERALLDWAKYFIDTCAEQVAFMANLLELDGLKKRIHALITFRASHDRAYRMEAVLPLHHLFAAGPLARGEFVQMTGLGERTGRNLVATLIRAGLVVSTSTHAALRFAFPIDALQFLLPGLYPEAAVRLTA